MITFSTPNAEIILIKPISHFVYFSSTAAWTPKYDGSIRPRDELVLLSPRLYEEKQRNEATNRKRMETLSV
jgi:hypothetical protein